MRRTVETAAARLAGAVQQAGTLARVASTHRARLARYCIGVVVLVGVILAAIVAVDRRPKPLGSITTESAESCRYLLVCGECGHRVRLTEFPKGVSRDDSGLFKCTQCNKYAATCYRHGSLSLPPGGW